MCKEIQYSRCIKCEGLFITDPEHQRVCRRCERKVAKRDFEALVREATEWANRPQ